MPDLLAWAIGCHPEAEFENADEKNKLGATYNTCNRRAKELRAALRARERALVSALEASGARRVRAAAGDSEAVVIELEAALRSTPA